VAKRFAKRGVDRFGLSAWVLERGMPRLTSVASWIVCSLATAVEGGDHLLLLGLVEDAEKTEAAPLIYTERMFGTHSGFAGA
jgi:flavin reductase (DIM6/NTAB) family NADH-FMN oxidoreductase RutF